MQIKKYFLFSLVLPCASNANDINNGPPAYQVKSAAIHIVQGANIYGNGKMQSVLRVRYELAQGVTLTTITLKEFGSEEPLSKIGWTESETDNGFDHNIGGARVENRLNDKKDKNYKNIYVSTTKKNSWLQACFELTTKKGAVTATYSTCQDEGIINGTVRIFSARPKAYSARDFIFKEAAYLLDLPSDITGMLHTLTPGYNIPRDMHFSVADFTYPGTYFLDNTNGLLRNYFDPPRDQEWAVSYVGTWLLKPNENTKFQVATKDMAIKETLIPTTLYPLAVMHFFHVQYRLRAYIVKDWRCKRSALGTGYEDCFVPDGKGGLVKLRKDYLSDLKPNMIYTPSTKLNLIDNYGTKHPLAIFYGFGEHAKTIFIE